MACEYKFLKFATRMQNVNCCSMWGCRCCWRKKTSSFVRHQIVNFKSWSLLPLHKSFILEEILSLPHVTAMLHYIGMTIKSRSLMHESYKKRIQVLLISLQILIIPWQVLRWFWWGWIRRKLKLFLSRTTSKGCTSTPSHAKVVL